jgi:hypothetical protein
MALVERPSHSTETVTDQITGRRRRFDPLHQ